VRPTRGSRSNYDFAEALLGLEVGHEPIVITWLHEAKRDMLKGHPRNDPTRPLIGVFYTRSPARPNPLGLHPVTGREVDGIRVKIGPIGRLSRLLHGDDTSGANFPLRARHPRAVARAIST
jgi:tRNA (Thr-GGU) A37 N-methylase